MADKAVKYDTKALDDLIKCFQDDYTLRVGILGSKATKSHDSESGLSNAELGTIHEFGSADNKHPPRRSFLEDSLKFKLRLDTEAFKELRKTLFKQFFVKKAPMQFMQDLGAKCLFYIEEGFATNGFGMWKPLASGSERAIAKKHKQTTLKQASKMSIASYRKSLRFWSARNILTETGKLRRSITFKVFKNGK